MKKTLKIICIILLIVMILIVAVASAAYVYINTKLSKMQSVEINEDELNIAPEVEEKLADYRNIVIYGIDSQGINYGIGDRSDCIIIASLNNVTSEIKLVSVYRDTYADINNHGLDKINHAYQFGSAQLALQTLNKNLDLNIKEFLAVDFDAVAEAVDELGGVEIEIQEDELNYINGYIQSVAKLTGKKANPITKAGKQLLNGVQSVAYSRIRYTTGWDYKRTERMRTVIAAMLQKLQTKSIGEINSLIDNILPRVYTNITTNDILALLPNVAKYKIVTSIGWPYRTRETQDGNYYGVPVTLESNVVQLHKEFFGDDNYVVSDTVKEISEKMIDKWGWTE